MTWQQGPVAEELRRELGIPGATMMGLGSIIGTGIFASSGSICAALPGVDWSGVYSWPSGWNDASGWSAWR